MSTIPSRVKNINDILGNINNQTLKPDYLVVYQNETEHLSLCEIMYSKNVIRLLIILTIIQNDTLQ